MNNPKQLNKANVVVITHPFNDVAGETSLGKFVDVLEPVSNRIFAITGDFPDRPGNKVHIIRIKRFARRKWLLTKIIELIWIQLKISFTLIRTSKHINIVVFYIGAGGYLLPMLTTKLWRKKAVVLAVGSALKSTRVIHAETLGGSGGVIFAYIDGLLQKINYMLSDLIGVVMESESLIRFLGLEKQRGKIIPFGYCFIDVDRFKLGRESGERGNIIGFVGRLSPEKGVMELAKAIPLILSQRNDARFLIVGDGPARNDMKRELQKAGCLDRVDFIGAVPNDKVAGYFNQIRFYVLPSHVEAFPIAAMEAMACGAISVANSVGGIPDMIQDGKTGFLLEDNQPRTIANKLLEVWEHPDLDKIQQRARAYVVEVFSYQKVIKTCERGLTSLLER